jgi:hypothetical protein
MDHKASTPRKGEQRLKEFFRRRQEKSPFRRQPPQPGDEDWPWWIQERLERIEDNQRWELRLIIGALIMQFALEVVPKL